MKRSDADVHDVLHGVLQEIEPFIKAVGIDTNVCNGDDEYETRDSYKEERAHGKTQKPMWTGQTVESSSRFIADGDEFMGNASNAALGKTIIDAFTELFSGMDDRLEIETARTGGHRSGTLQRFIYTCTNSHECKENHYIHGYLCRGRRGAATRRSCRRLGWR
jgi:hypothetical protein